MIRVGVARGGPGAEYDVSLAHGAAVLRALQDMNDEFEAVDILVARDGTWHLRGMPVTIDTFAPKIDVIWNALHGAYGENGELARILDDRGVIHTSAPHMIGSMTHHKNVFKERAQARGFKIPDGFTYTQEEARDTDELVREIHTHIAPPWIVKPVAGGHSLGVMLARSVPELARALESALSSDEPFLVEQYIYGREIVGGILKNFRNKDAYSLLPIEVKRKQGILNYADRMEGRTPHLLLGGHQDEKAQIEKFFIDLNQELPLGFATTGDFIASDRGLYLIEIDAQPSVLEHSPIIHALAEVGATIHDYVRSGVSFALARK